MPPNEVDELILLERKGWATKDDIPNVRRIVVKEWDDIEAELKYDLSPLDLAVPLSQAPHPPAQSHTDPDASVGPAGGPPLSRKKTRKAKQTKNTKKDKRDGAKV